MKKYIAVVLAACLALVCLCACSGKKTYDIQELLSAVEASAGLTDPVDLTEEDLNYDMGLTMENIDSFAGKTENVNGASGRVLVGKAVSGKGEDVKTELQSYVTSRAEFLGNYEEFAGAKAQAEQARVVASGDYVILVMANEGMDYAAVDEAIEAAFA